MKRQNKIHGQNNFLTILWIMVGVLGRLIPHIPNTTPMNSLSLFAGSMLPKYLALPIILVTMLISDVALSFIYHYPILSSWSLFTYSGFAIITLIGTKLSSKVKISQLAIFILSSSMFFWLWTNFGVWLTSAIFAKSFAGLVNCYIIALPFLANELLGNVVWTIAIFGGFSLICWLERCLLNRSVETVKTKI